MIEKHEQDDEALLKELSELIERLRTSRYQHVMGEIRKVSFSQVEDFSDLFSKHLLYEEDIIFPALREPAPPKIARKLTGLKREHEKLRGFAKKLLKRVRGGNEEGACEIGRLFMAALSEHINRESEVTRQVLINLHPSTAATLKSKLGLGGVSAS